jgi:hypothetical protein
MHRGRWPRPNQGFGGLIMKRSMMKKRVLVVFMVCGVVALAQAQAQAQTRRTPAPAEKVTVTGNLTIARGMPALMSGGITYYVAGMQRFVGFIDGLKEGANVTLEGAAYRHDDTSRFLRVSKMTLNGKDYDLAPIVPKGIQGPQSSKTRSPKMQSPKTQPPKMQPQRFHQGGSKARKR